MITYPNGLRLSVSEMPELNTCTIVINFTGGFQGETQLLNGTCEVIARLLTCGTKTYPSVAALNSYAKSQGFILSARAETEYLQLTLSCLKTKIEKAIDFVYDIVFNSTFDENYLAAIKSQIQAEIELAKMNPQAGLSVLSNQALFARTGLINTRLGNTRSIERISRDVVLAQYEKYLSPKNIVISIGGAVDEEKAENLIEKSFYARTKDLPFRQIKFVSTVTGFEGFVNIKNRPFNQSRIEIAFPSVSFKNNKKYALSIMARVLETAIKERVANEMYFKSVKIDNVTYANNGKFCLTLIVDGENAEAFIQKVLVAAKNIIRMRDLSVEDFKAEKNLFITNFVLNAEKSDELTKLSADELTIAKTEFDLNDKFEVLAGITFDYAFDALVEVFDLNKISVAYLGKPIEMAFLKDVILG